MITRITTKEAKAAIEDCMTHAAITGNLDGDFERYRAIRVYGIFEYTYRFTSAEGLVSVIEEIRKEEFSLSEEEKAVLIVSPACPVTLDLMQRVKESLEQMFPRMLISWQTMNMGAEEEEKEDGEDSITVIIYREGEPRPRFSEIRNRYSYLQSVEKREAKSLQGEFDRNAGKETLAVITEQEFSDMVSGHHLLWHGAAASTTSASVIVDQLKNEILARKKEYDVSGMFLFIDVDKNYTTMSEVLALRDGLASLAGEDADVSINIIVEDSHIKSMACRVYLVGNPKYVKGDVYMDFGRYEILLYQSDDTERGHMIVASYEDEELTIARYDWGDFERNRHGQTDDHHYFDKENTLKLGEALHAKRPETLLRRLKDRFAYHSASSADYYITQFCKNAGISYHSEYYY